MVLADFFSVILITYMATQITTVALRMSYVYLVAALFSVWCFIDVLNYSNAQRIFPYESWLAFLL